MGGFFQTTRRKSESNLQLGDSMAPTQNVHWSLCSRSGVEETRAAGITRGADRGADPARSSLADFSVAGMGTRHGRAKYESISAPGFRFISNFTWPAGGGRMGDAFRRDLLWLHSLRRGRNRDLDGRGQSLGSGLCRASAGPAVLRRRLASGWTRIVEPSLGGDRGRVGSLRSRCLALSPTDAAQ